MNDNRSENKRKEIQTEREVPKGVRLYMWIQFLPVCIRVLYFLIDANKVVIKKSTKWYGCKKLAPQNRMPPSTNILSSTTEQQQAASGKSRISGKSSKE